MRRRGPSTTPRQVEHLGLQDLAAAERQQLAVERRPPGRPATITWSTSARAGSPAGIAVARGARRSRDDREQVVEVVRDAAGELADGLHLLGLPELVLEHRAAR